MDSNSRDGAALIRQLAGRVTRRSFLRRSVALGGLALTAISGEAACRSAAAKVPESAFLMPTPIRGGRPTPAPDPTAIRSASSSLAAARPTAQPDPAVAQAAAPTPAPVPAETPAVEMSVKAPPRQPNVLLVTIDTLRADRTGAYGFAKAHTPVLDQFAREGVRFEHAICQLPQTNASHASLMTGLYPSTNGVKIHMVDKLRSDAQTIATVFASAGYQTAGIYSWVSLDPQFSGLNLGFQTYQGYVLNRSAMFSNPTLESLAATYRQLKSQVPIISTADAAIGASGDIEETLDGRADVTNDAVFKWLDEHVDAGPFFLWVHYFDPHYPYAPPSGYDHILGLDYHGSIDGSVATMHKIEKDQLSPSPADIARLGELYQGEIAFTDAQLGKLLDYLAKRGIKDDTIITVTGDHGESFGEHDDWMHGLRVYETEIRVPLWLRYPRRVPNGVVVAAPAQLIDVLPTLADLAGVRTQKSVQGSSLLPVITGQAKGADRFAFTELADESFVSVLTAPEWKLIRKDSTGEVQLFHLDDDEAEQHDLSQDQPQTTRELSARLQDLMKISGVTR